MTKENIAKKAKNYAWNYPIPYSLYEKIEDKKEQIGEVIEQAYIAGATENGIQWHFMKDVKCYEDLPTNRDVL